MKQQKIIALAALLVTAMIWGLSYSAQAQAMENLPPLFFVSLRYLIAALFVSLLCFCRFLIRRWLNNALDVPVTVGALHSGNKLWLGGICCGFFLAGGEILQQFGLLYTTAGNTGFLTALYVIMIPLIGMFMRKKVQCKIWIAAIISMLGSFGLCYTGDAGGFSCNRGDLLAL